MKTIIEYVFTFIINFFLNLELNTHFYPLFKLKVSSYEAFIISNEGQDLFYSLDVKEFYVIANDYC